MHIILDHEDPTLNYYFHCKGIQHNFENNVTFPVFFYRCVPEDLLPDNYKECTYLPLLG